MKNSFKLEVAMVLFAIAVMASYGRPQTTASAQSNTAGFAPLEQWRNAVLAGDPVALKTLYSTNPAAKVKANSSVGEADLDTSFWLGLKARSIELEIVRSTTPRPDLQHVIFRADVVSGLPNGQSITVANDQVWRKQSEQWRLVDVTRVDAPQLKQPADMKKDIYPASADAHADLEKAEKQAAQERKRVLLVFGANWCYDCHVLDLAFQRADVAPLLAAGYELVHIDLGPDGEKNADLVKQFEVPLDKGVPALAVAESDGKLVVSQKNGEFENARALTPAELLRFLQQWMPEAHGAETR